MSKKIIYKTPEQIDNIAEAGKYLTELLLLTKELSKPWVTWLELEAHAQSYMDANNITWAFKWYGWFPANLCVSINDCVVHGIPDGTLLKLWDLVKIDVGVTYNHCIADAAISFIVWWAKENKKGQHLIDVTKWALDAGLKMIVSGKSMFDFGKTVYNHVTSNWCSVIKNLTGHGVWVEVHEWPPIYNWANGDMQRYRFEPWMVIALEPITAIKSSVYIEKKWIPWNLYTKKWDLGAQREYTLAITDNGYEILAWVV